jgi:hypothetical protein
MEVPPAFPIRIPGQPDTARHQPISWIRTVRATRTYLDDTLSLTPTLLAVCRVMVTLTLRNFLSTLS